MLETTHPKANRRPGKPNGFTLVELLVVVSIIGLLLAILLPALSKASGQAKAVRCMSNMKQISTAMRMYLDENRGVVVPLWIARNAPGWYAWDYDADTFVVQVDAMMWWPDKLRKDEYAASADLFNCPTLDRPAVKAGGGSISTAHPLGIGMNYPEVGTLAVASGFEYPVYGRALESQVARPSEFATFADSAAIDNRNEPDADAWREVAETGCVYFRVPSDTFSYADGDARSVPRHGGKVNSAFFDGHVEQIQNSDFRYDLPRTDGTVLWAKNARGTTP